jgi:hypothetical protein
VFLPPTTVEISSNILSNTIILNDMTDTIKTTLIAGLFAVLGGIGGTMVTGIYQIQLARQKFSADLVLKALESNSPEQRLQSLKLLVETNLLKDEDIKNGVMKYAKDRENNPSIIPQITSAVRFESPIVSNSRIYLLAGNKSKQSLFPSYKSQLDSAGYKVLGAKVIVDAGRPNQEEVRFFYQEDKAQAEKIAEVLKFKLSISQLQAKLYSDRNAKPGYIEIWFGK